MNQWRTLERRRNVRGDSIYSTFTNNQCLCGVASPLAILISTFSCFLISQWLPAGVHGLHQHFGHVEHLTKHHIQSVLLRNGIQSFPQLVGAKRRLSG